MSLTLEIARESTSRPLVRRDALERLGERIIEGEGRGGDHVVSLLLCDDPRMQDINRQWRGKDAPTDVLSFEQDDLPGSPEHVLGDIVISLETVARRHPDDPDAMRGEVRLLFCHGLLHLLGYDHETARDRARMKDRQARYLGLPLEAAWPEDPGPDGPPARRSAQE